jgi:hypothetical protein
MIKSYPNTAFVTLEDGTRVVYLYGTAIVTVYPTGVIRLDTGGWRSRTTRTRINQVAEDLRLNLGVFFSKGNLLLAYDGWDFNLGKANSVVLCNGAVLAVE